MNKFERVRKAFSGRKDTIVHVTIDGDFHEQELPFGCVSLGTITKRGSLYDFRPSTVRIFCCKGRPLNEVLEHIAAYILYGMNGTG